MAPPTAPQDLSQALAVAQQYAPAEASEDQRSAHARSAAHAAASAASFAHKSRRRVGANLNRGAPRQELSQAIASARGKAGSERWEEQYDAATGRVVLVNPATGETTAYISW